MDALRIGAFIKEDITVLAWFHPSQVQQESITVVLAVGQEHWSTCCRIWWGWPLRESQLELGCSPSLAAAEHGTWSGRAVVHETGKVGGASCQRWGLRVWGKEVWLDETSHCNLPFVCMRSFMRRSFLLTYFMGFVQPLCFN